MTGQECTRYRDPESKKYVRIDSQGLPPAAQQASLQNKITTLDLGGGMASGLEMVLRNGLIASRECVKGVAATLEARRRLEASPSSPTN